LRKSQYSYRIPAVVAGVGRNGALNIGVGKAEKLKLEGVGKSAY